MDRRAVDEFVERARNVLDREELDRAAVAVLDAFDAAGIESLVLKGPALARLLYEEKEHRGYFDVDLLIDRENLADAGRALTRLGYIFADPAFGLDVVDGVQHGETWARAGLRGPLCVDLHWRLAGCTASDQEVWAALSDRSVQMPLNGREARVLDSAGLALHVALHAAQHGPGDLKAMSDLGRGVDRWDFATWSAAGRLAGELGASQAFAAGLRLLPAGSTLATQLRLPDTRELEWKILNRERRPRGTFHAQALAAARGPRQRFNVLRRSLFPTRVWIVREFPWAGRSRPLLLAGYARHLLRAPGWTVRAWAFRRRARRAGSD